MKHVGTIPLQTDRLQLRRFRMSDAAMLYDCLQNPAVTQYLRFTTHASIEVTRRFLADCITRYSEKTRYFWAVEWDGTVIGAIGANVYESQKRMELFYFFGQPWWGKGFATECVSALLPLFFDQLGAQQVNALCDPQHAASARVLEKAGLIYCGDVTQEQVYRNFAIDPMQYVKRSGHSIKHEKRASEK